MAGGSSPINIATHSRHPTPLHLQHTSNLTSALQSTTGNELRPTSAVNISNASGRSAAGGAPGLGMYHGSGAQPISMSGSNLGHPRRESAAGSAMGGISWGGVSVGSWIRDDVIMQGSSPFGHQSSSFHSSSYLPKLEASFLTRFSCCGQAISDFHNLVQHFEELHAQHMYYTPITEPRTDLPDQALDKKPTQPSNTTGTTDRHAQQQVPQQPVSSTIGNRPSMAQISTNNLDVSESNQQYPCYNASEYSQMTSHMGQDMDDVGDMEMDDFPGVFSDMSLTHPQHSQFQSQDLSQFRPKSHFEQSASARVSPLDLNALNLGSPLQAHQGLRNSQPATPVSGGKPGVMYSNNPCVSSVNTPTLSTYPLQQQQQQQQYRNSPDSSTPGTPGGSDPDFSHPTNNFPVDNTQQYMQGNFPSFGGYGFGNGNGNDMVDLCIDDPAKRLFSPGGFSDSGSNINNRLGGAQYGPNSEIAMRIREQQRLVGLADTVSGLNGEEPKPFRCPVIGCEKAYKNQNGLKYHKSHGHNNQQLHENLDGTYSIVDPATSTPYPGTLGMEKEKPYKCESCGKRYKNLNGLKYHKSHAPSCNPELKLAMGIPEPSNIHGMNVNVAGAGLPGLGEEMGL